MTELVECTFKGTLVPLLGTDKPAQAGSSLVLTKASLKDLLAAKLPEPKKQIGLTTHQSFLPGDSLEVATRVHAFPPDTLT